MDRKINVEMGTKQLIINIVASITSLMVSIGISFFLTPYIVQNVGSEAYGFVGLANNFVGYSQLVTLALNSMALRFITVSVHKNNMEEANKYFNSVIFGNVIMSAVLCIPASLIIIYIEKILEVPDFILLDVKILWSLIFLNCLIGLVTSGYNVATYVSNRLELSSLRSIESNLLKATLYIMLFSAFTVKVWYIGIVSIVCTIFVFAWEIIYRNRLLPELKVSLKYFDFRKIIELITSGAWNVVTKLGQILTNGLDLLLTNLFISASTMGILAIAQTVPLAFSSLMSSVSSVFCPQLTINYAKDNMIDLVKELKKSMKITGFFTNIPLMVFLSLGELFYSLWVPQENSEFLFQLTFLIIIGTVISGVITSLFNVYSIVNKLKLNSLVTLGMGFLNIIMVFPLLKFTNFGIYAIVGVSTFNGIIKNLTFTPINAAQCLGVSKLTFYPIILRYFLSTTAIGACCFIIVSVLNPTTWFTMIFTGIICGLVGMALNAVILFSKDESLDFLLRIVSRIKKC
ncbi:MAG: MATE family efflux transporter [Clostridia bacterium]